MSILALMAVLFGVAYRPAAPPSGPRVEVLLGSTALVQYTVHVAGAVREPGLVIVDAGSRVADAIAAAGGASTSANLSAVNLAAPIDDGMQLVVPGMAESADLQAVSANDGRIDINRAGVSELSDLPGVGAVLAGRIVAYRERNGPFAAVEDLLDVSGIGEGKLAAIRELSVVR